MNDGGKIYHLNFIGKLINFFFLAAFLSRFISLILWLYLVTFPQSISTTFIRINHHHTYRILRYTDRASMTSATPWTEGRLLKLLSLLTNISTIQSKHSFCRSCFYVLRPGFVCWVYTAGSHNFEQNTYLSYGKTMAWVRSETKRSDGQRCASPQAI